MRKIAGLLASILAIMVMAGCESKKTTKSVKTIDLRDTYKEIHDVKLSEIATSINYIALETKESSLISRIVDVRHDLVFSENHILVRDVSNILFLYKKMENL